MTYHEIITGGDGLNYHKATIKRLLDTKDPWDQVFKLDTKSPLSFAFTNRGISDASTSHAQVGDNGKSLGGTKKYWITADSVTGAIYTIKKSNLTKTTHGWVEYAAWGILIFLNFISGRYFKNKWMLMPIIHWITGAIIFGLSVFGFWLYYVRAGYRIYDNIHSVMGFILTIVVIV